MQQFYYLRKSNLKEVMNPIPSLKRLSLFFMLALFVSTVSYGQLSFEELQAQITQRNLTYQKKFQTDFCGTMKIPENQVEPEDIIINERLNRLLNSSGTNGRNGGATWNVKDGYGASCANDCDLTAPASCSTSDDKFRVPVVHTVSTTGTPPTQADIDAKLSIMNDFFACQGVPIEFYKSTTYSGAPTTGDNSTRFLNLGSTYNSANVTNVPDVVNIFIFSKTSDASSGCNGFAFLPTGSTAPNTVVMGSECYSGFVYTSGTLDCTTPNLGLSIVAIHELGHYLGLYHSHETNKGADCDDPATPADDCSKGDYIADTDEDPDFSGDEIGCTGCDTGTAQGDCSMGNAGNAACAAYGTPNTINNIMSYNNFAGCRTAFTPCQKAKMVDALLCSRGPQMCSRDVTAEFAGGASDAQKSICIGDAAPTFTATSSCYKWYDGIGASGTTVASGATFTPTTGTGAGQLDNNTPGTYTWYLGDLNEINANCRTAVTVIVSPNSGTAFSGGANTALSLSCTASETKSFTADGANIGSSTNLVGWYFSDSDPSSITTTTAINTAITGAANSATLSHATGNVIQSNSGTTALNNQSIDCAALETAGGDGTYFMTPFVAFGDQSVVCNDISSNTSRFAFGGVFGTSYATSQIGSLSCSPGSLTNKIFTINLNITANSTGQAATTFKARLNASTDCGTVSSGTSSYEILSGTSHTFSAAHIASRLGASFDPTTTAFCVSIVDPNNSAGTISYDVTTTVTYTGDDAKTKWDNGSTPNIGLTDGQTSTSCFWGTPIQLTCGCSTCPVAGTPITTPTNACANSTTPIDLFSLLIGETEGGSWEQTTGSGGTFNAGMGTFVPSGATAGAATFRYSIAASTGCDADMEDVTVTVNAVPNAGTPRDTTVCDTENTPINLAGQLDGADAGGSWIRIPGSSGGTFAEETGMFTPAVGATTSTFAYITTQTGCISDTTIVKVIINSGPTLTSAKTDPMNCGVSDGKITLSGLTASTTYKLNYKKDGTAVTEETINTTATTYDISSLGAAMYTEITVISTATNACLSNQTAQTLEDPGSPTVNKPASQAVCVATMTQGIVFAGTADASFAWTSTSNGTGLGASGTANIAAFTGTNATSDPVIDTITVTPTKDGCMGAAQTFTITVNPLPAIDSEKSNPTECNANGTITITDLKANEGYTLNYKKAGTAVTAAPITSTGTGTFIITGLDAADYTEITVTETATGCTSASTSQTLSDPTPPTVSGIVNQTVCGGTMTTTVDFAGIVLFAGPVITYDWTNDNTMIGLGASGTGNIPAFTTMNTGSVQLTAEITVTPKMGNCIGTAKTFTIIVDPLPMIASTKTDPTTCGASDGKITITGMKNSTAYKLNYKKPGTVVGEANITSTGTGTYDIPTLDAAAYTEITVTETATGCVSNQTAQTLEDPGSPTVTKPADQAVCVATMTQAIIFAGTTGATFEWTSTSNGTGLSATSGMDTIFAFTGTNATSDPVTDTITVTPTKDGCTGMAQTFTITVNPLPVITGRDTILCLGDTINLANFVSGTVDTLAFGTTFGTYTLGGVKIPTTTDTTYFVQGSANGCLDTAKINIGIIDITSAGLAMIACDDNNSAHNITDDSISFSLTVQGVNVGSTGYTVSVSSGTISPTSGTYGSATIFGLQSGSAGAGNVVVTITDATHTACTETVEITDPGICSTPVVVNTTVDDSEQSTMPDLSGNTSVLSATLTALGISGNSNTHVICDQDPAPGTSLNSNTVVSFNICPITSSGGVVTVGNPVGSGSVTITLTSTVEDIRDDFGVIPGSGSGPRLDLDDFDVTDPCSCTDPDNVTVNGVYLFHDILTVEATPNRDVRVSVADGEFRGRDGVALLPSQRILTETSVGSGIYQLHFWHRSGVSTTVTVQVNGLDQPPFTSSVCNQEDCIIEDPIPTMSEWGLLIFGLLMLNLSLMLIFHYQEELKY